MFLKRSLSVKKYKMKYFCRRWDVQPGIYFKYQEEKCSWEEVDDGLAMLMNAEAR